MSAMRLINPCPNSGKPGLVGVRDRAVSEEFPRSRSKESKFSKGCKSVKDLLSRFVEYFYTRYL